jgi:hypothetical protein
VPFFAASEAPPRPESAKFPVFSQIAGNLAFRDEFAADSPLQRRVRCEPRSNRSRNIIAIIVGTEGFGRVRRFEDAWLDRWPFATATAG